MSLYGYGAAFCVSKKYARTIAEGRVGFQPSQVSRTGQFAASFKWFRAPQNPFVFPKKHLEWRWKAGEQHEPGYYA
jgi:hypothetical protein